ncbi:hypothetical protein QIS99_12030 [Streptomyces sp. B-S-A8]|uniref:Uncharacterized protein n=1 Tax=Streptomyces solicavernae TaxID=3043614 RepID=A0ABT6RR61_9ACTN|nr:hypothetical protein [Streptomyces sp. B-S-A8]MDI3386924.1 hypothetical protein [Streptomyces sp. B-S-A8]
MNESGTLRLLPWTAVDGKPCFLVSDGDGYLSRVADNIEAVQLGMGSDLLTHATHMLKEQEISTGELHFLACRLAEALKDVLRVAESRGARLPTAEHEDADPRTPGDAPDGDDDLEPPAPAR